MTIICNDSYNTSGAAVPLAGRLLTAALIVFGALGLQGAPAPQGAPPPWPRAPLGDTSDLRDPASGRDGPLQFRLTRPQVQPGERTTLEISISVDTLKAAGWDEESGPPELNDTLLTQTRLIQILDSTYQRTSDRLVWGYELTSHWVGELTLPPVELRVGTSSLSTEALTLTVISSRQPEDNRIREEFGPLSPPSRWWYWPLWLSLLPLAYAVRAWLERRLPQWLARLRRPPPLPPPPLPEDPLLWLRREFLRLRHELEMGANEQFADDLTRVLREYFHRKTQLPVQAFTTREIVHRLATEPAAQALLPVWRHCDEVKFTGRRGNFAEAFFRDLLESERVLCGT